jgi:hypothetical protein
VCHQVHLNRGLDYVHLDDLLVDLKLTPDALEVPVPRYFVEDRAKVGGWVCGCVDVEGRGRGLFVYIRPGRRPSPRNGSLGVGVVAREGGGAVTNNKSCTGAPQQHISVVST